MSAKTIAVTRPPSDKDALTDALHARGYVVVSEPLTHVSLRHTAQAALAAALKEEPDAVVATSRHGVLALAALSPVRDLALICVGESTQNAALAAGFTRATAAGGTVEHLIDTITHAYDQGTRLLYVSGKHIRIDLASVIEKQGMIVDRVVLYDAAASDHFSDTFVEHMRRGHVHAVTFLSVRAAEIFTRLAAQAALEEPLRAMQAYGMSRAIAGTLDASAWQHVHTPDAPRLESLIHSIERTL